MLFWLTWDEPDRDIAVARWEARGICVIFPLSWAKCHDQKAMIGRAKERIEEIEGKSGRTLVAGSVLLAFSRHGPLTRKTALNPEVSQALG